MLSSWLKVAVLNLSISLAKTATALSMQDVAAAAERSDPDYSDDSGAGKKRQRKRKAAPRKPRGPKLAAAGGGRAVSGKMATPERRAEPDVELSDSDEGEHSTLVSVQSYWPRPFYFQTLVGSSCSQRATNDAASAGEGLDASGRMSLLPGTDTGCTGGRQERGSLGTPSLPALQLLMRSSRRRECHSRSRRSRR